MNLDQAILSLLHIAALSDLYSVLILDLNYLKV